MAVLVNGLYGPCLFSMWRGMSSPRAAHVGIGVAVEAASKAADLMPDWARGDGPVAKAVCAPPRPPPR